MWTWWLLQGTVSPSRRKSPRLFSSPASVRKGQRIFSKLPPVVKRESEIEFDVALRQLDQFFELKTNVIVERFTFRQQCQNTGETTAEYVSVL